jgi:hypothetical protein
MIMWYVDDLKLSQFNIAALKEVMKWLESINGPLVGSISNQESVYISRYGFGGQGQVYEGLDGIILTGNT